MELRDWGKRWAGAAYCADHWLELTPDELTQFTSELEEVFARWATPERPAGPQAGQRERVYTFTYAFPVISGLCAAASSRRVEQA